MKEIKFRAWHKESGYMYEVTQIDWVQQRIYGKAIKKSWWLPFNEIELMQYTGLKDSKNRDIFEGDLLGRAGKWIVQINPINYYLTSGINLSNLLSNDMEVIGNIYENPELLEKADPA